MEKTAREFIISKFHLKYEIRKRTLLFFGNDVIQLSRSLQTMENDVWHIHDTSTLKVLVFLPLVTNQREYEDVASCPLDTSPKLALLREGTEWAAHVARVPEMRLEQETAHKPEDGGQFGDLCV
jgi:hypothetical protein